MIPRIQKIRLVLMYAALAVLLLPFAFAEAQTVVSGDLEVTFEAMPLFSNTNVGPGESVTRTVAVTNNGSDAEELYASTDNAQSTGLAEVMNLLIAASSSGTTYFNNGFDDFFGPFPASLGSVNAGETRVYTFTALLPSGLGNAYQGTNMSFDLIIGFEGGSSVSDGGGGGGGTSNNDPEDDTEPEGEIAGASTTVPTFFGRGGSFPFEDFIGEAFGASTNTDDAATTTEEERETPAGLVAQASAAGADFFESNCVFLWLLLLVVISMSWSTIEDRLGKHGGLFGQFFVRNAVFTIVYIGGLILFELLGVLETFWWAFAGIWAVMVGVDYWAHKFIADFWSSWRRNLYFGAVSLAFAALGLFTPLLCVWVPFVIVMLVSTFLLFLDE